MRKTFKILAVVVLGLTASIAVSSPASAVSSLRFHSVQYDPKGVSDGGTLLNREWVQLINRGTRSVDLLGYTIHNKDGKTYRFGNVTIPPYGGRVWLRSGSGTDTARTVYWGNGNFAWNVDGDKAFLRNRKGQSIHTCSWTYVKGRDWVRCPVAP